MTLVGWLLLLGGPACYAFVYAHVADLPMVAGLFGALALVIGPYLAVSLCTPWSAR